VSESTTGSTDSKRIRLNLTLAVTKTHFSAASSTTSDGNPNAQSQGATLAITGRVTSENIHVKLGSFHTLDIEVNRDLKIIKEDWDNFALETVAEACVEGRGADVGALICGEGTAAICLLSEHMTVIKQRLEVNIPRKRSGSSTLREKGLTRFYEILYNSILRHLPYQTLKVIIIASPGFIKDTVYDYIFSEALRTTNKALLQSRPKFLRVHVNSPHVHSLMEVIKSPEVSNQLKESKFAREGVALDKFFKMLGEDEMRAWYGMEHVLLAAERSAIGTLLISDHLFRSGDPVLRKKYIALVESVRQTGGEVFVFSSMHESGQQLNQITGIAALLTFPLDVEVVEAEEALYKKETQEKQDDAG